MNNRFDESAELDPAIDSAEAGSCLIPVAVFGTLLSGAPNHHLLNGAKYVGSGYTVDPFTMLASYRDGERCGYPLLFDRETGSAHNLPAAPVRVEVFMTSSSGLRGTDILEGHPTFYRREPTAIILDDDCGMSGAQLVAWMYVTTPHNLRGPCLPYRTISNSDFRNPVFMEDDPYQTHTADILQQSE